MPSEFTRSGVRRSGDDYRDLVAPELLLDMLEHPERFAWAEVEADDWGALDDVVVQRMDGCYLGRQVKFSAHPEEEDDPWTWDSLPKQEAGKRGPLRSLLQKWAKGYSELIAPRRRRRYLGLPGQCLAGSVDEPRPA